MRSLGKLCRPPAATGAAAAVAVEADIVAVVVAEADTAVAVVAEVG